MENLTIRKVTPTDINRLQQISRDTFAETFFTGNSEENLKKYLEEELSIEKLTAELQNPDSEFYFALLNQTVIGYLKLNFGQAQTELKDDKGLEIERIYVLRKFHGKKVAQGLYDKAIEVANERKVDYVWLGVWEENPRAIN